MPYIWTNPAIKLEHKDITVYHTYKDDLLSNGPRKFWYTTDINGFDNADDYAFDIRTLSTYAENMSHADIIKAAIDKNELQKPTE